MDTFRPAVHYEVTPDGKLGLYLGDELMHAHGVPEPWEYEAAMARRRGDEGKVKRILGEQMEQAREKMIARLMGGLHGN